MEIKYTHGTIQPIVNTNYADLKLYNGKDVVYKATVPLSEIDVIIVMNKNISTNETKRQ